MRARPAALFLALSIAAAPMALADGPADLGMTRGALAVGDQVLFVSDRQADGPCTRPCSASAFIAAPGAVAGGRWTLTPTEGGAQWVYDGRPLFLWPEIGANFGRYYFGYDFMADHYGLRPALIRDPVGEGLALGLGDPRIATRPRIERRALVNYGLYSDSPDTGTVEATACVDRRGDAGPVEITASSGASRLDALTLEFAQKIQFVPAATSAGEPVAVCGATISVVWTNDSPSGLRQGPGNVIASTP